LKCEWDEAKNLTNLAKHSLSFEDAELVFSGPCFTFEDDRFDYGERRFITLGKLVGRLVAIAQREARRRNSHHLHEERKPT